MDDLTAMTMDDITAPPVPMRQQVILSILPKLTSAISIVALVYAIQFILRSPQRMRILSNRLFLGMYSVDLARCLTFLIGTWMIPAGTDGVFMATGNGCTCAIQAFVSQLGLAVPLYAASVSVYFVLAIQNNFNITMYRYAEKWCHICPVFIGLLLSILLVVYKKYGADGTRCWITPTTIKCLNEDYFERDAECQQRYDIIDGSTRTVTHRSLMFSTWIFENGLCILSIFLLICLFTAGITIETKKRHNNGSLQGKRKYLDMARQRKARFFLSQIFTNLLSVIICFGIYHLARYSAQLCTHTTASFTFLVFGTTLNNLFGFTHVLIFLKVKLDRNEALAIETSNFSIRKSVRSKESFNLVTGGYVPKKRFLPPKGDYGGIYLGDDDDDEVGDEALDDFDICCDDFNAGTSMTLGSVGDDFDLPSPGPLPHKLSPARTNVPTDP
mmetsp:Transcript_22007/g.27758  ORF Transcript_22007/g.27758 Transcript_22007/m.27758 type:complete len:443 (-) Transcript_22007:453-1781(-)